MSKSSAKQGALFAIAAYLCWGLFPAYFKLLGDIPAGDILMYRILFSAIFMSIMISLMRGWPNVILVGKQPRLLLMLAATAFIIGGNWLIYIWAINNGHMLESSLGYFINPLVSVFLGVVFLKERLRGFQWIAVALALIGVLIQLVAVGTLPWIALGLAFTFGSYGLLRKKLGVNSQSGLMIETLWLLPVSLIYLFGFTQSAVTYLVHGEPVTILLLIGSGVVTSVPLLFFTSAATRLPLSTLGFFQYISPTLVFLLAIFVYGEQMTINKLVTFVFIWLALAFFIIDATYRQRHVMRTLQSGVKNTQERQVDTSANGL